MMPRNFGWRTIRSTRQRLSQERFLNRNRRRLLVESLESRRVLATLVVTDLSDSADIATLAGDGQLSLREALHAANTDTSVDGSPIGNGHDEIVFAAGLTGTIGLQGRELVIQDDVSITGPGAELLTLDGNLLSRVLHIFPESNVEITDLTVSRGQDGLAAGIWNRGGNLSLLRINLVGNQATSGAGGAIFNQPIGPGATLTVRDSFIQNNSAQFGGGIASGGADGVSTLVIENTEFNANSGAGGGLMNSGFGGGTANTTVTNSRFINNTSPGVGGAIFNDSRNLGTTEMTIRGSRISGGAAEWGGGLADFGAGNVASNVQIIDTEISGASAT